MFYTNSSSFLPISKKEQRSDVLWMNQQGSQEDSVLWQRIFVSMQQCLAVSGINWTSQSKACCCQDWQSLEATWTRCFLNPTWCPLQSLSSLDSSLLAAPALDTDLVEPPKIGTAWTWQRSATLNQSNLYAMPPKLAYSAQQSSNTQDRQNLTFETLGQQIHLPISKRLLLL